MISRAFIIVFAAGFFFTFSAFGQETHKNESNDLTAVSKVSSDIIGDRQNCVQGFAGDYPCQGVDLLSFVSIQTLNGGVGDATATNDIWGWEDPETGKEYALVGMNSGISFVDISDPVSPQVIGFLPLHSTLTSVWRDVKVYADHAFVVADNALDHGMQVFDLTQLGSIENPPVLLEETAHYGEFASAHNIAINEETGFAYVVGIGSGGTTCGGGLHMINIQSPTEPEFAGCFADVSTGRRGTGYSHDVQCVIYEGPDADYQGREICIGSNETALSIADVTDKENPVRVSVAEYPSIAYTHQGWLSEDHRYFFLDDELDEPNVTANTRTIIFDVQDLDDPVFATTFLSTERSRDHNQYVRGDHLFQSNYTSGLRILNISDPVNPQEVAYFDVLPNVANTTFTGSWSNYPYFESGSIIATSTGAGFFVVKPVAPGITSIENEIPTRAILEAPFPNPFQTQTQFSIQLEKTGHVDVEVYDLLGRKVDVIFSGTIPSGSPYSIVFQRGNLPNGEYIIRARGDGISIARTVTVVK